MVGNGTRGGHVAGGGYLAGRKIDQRLAYRVGHQDALLQPGKFAGVKARALRQRHQHTGHPVLELDGNTLRSGGNIGSLTPQKIAGLVSAQKAVFGLGRLVFGQLESIGIHRRRRAIRVIADDVDVRILILKGTSIN